MFFFSIHWEHAPQEFQSLEELQDTNTLHDVYMEALRIDRDYPRDKFHVVFLGVSNALLVTAFEQIRGGGSSSFSVFPITRLLGSVGGLVGSHGERFFQRLLLGDVDRGDQKVVLVRPIMRGETMMALIPKMVAYLERAPQAPRVVLDFVTLSEEDQKKFADILSKKDLGPIQFARIGNNPEVHMDISARDRRLPGFGASEGSINSYHPFMPMGASGFLRGQALVKNPIHDQLVRVVSEFRRRHAPSLSGLGMFSKGTVVKGQRESPGGRRASLCLGLF